MPSQRRTVPAPLTALVAVAFAGFVAVLVMVVTGTGIVHLDHAVADSLSGTYGWFYWFSNRLTEVLSPPVDATIVAVTGAVLAIRRRRADPVIVALWSLLIGAVVILEVKYAVHRPAPEGQPVSRGEFPSGHTAAMGLYVGTAVLLLARGRLRAVGLVAVGLLACLIGTALVYDRFHWLSDVVGSLLLAPALLWWVASTPAMARHDAAETARARSGGPAAVPARRRITSPATDPRSPS